MRTRHLLPAALATAALVVAGTAVANTVVAPDIPSLRDAAGVVSVAPPPSTIAFTGELATVTLAKLPVKGRAPMTGYERKAQFFDGVHDWIDLDRNGCDSREDMLKRDLAGPVIRGRCDVRTGTLADPYSGRSIPFTAGRCTAGQVDSCSLAVQIDHVVSLGNAWATGAQQIPLDRRQALASDPTNLQATYGPLNSQKGDGDAATWLPPNKRYRCAYVARQLTVKQRYRLWLTEPERTAIARVLADCPDQRIAR